MTIDGAVGRAWLIRPDGSRVEVGVTHMSIETVEHPGATVVSWETETVAAWTMQLTPFGEQWVQAFYDLIERPTAWLLRRRRAPLCPTCGHRSRCWLLPDMRTWTCRWGHLAVGA